MQNQTKPQPSEASMAKVILVIAIIASLGMVLGVAGYLAMNKQTGVIVPEIKKEAERNNKQKLVMPKEETEKVKLYFSNVVLAKENHSTKYCRSDYPVSRSIKQDDPEKMALSAVNELIKGPTVEEQSQKYYLIDYLMFPFKNRVEKHKKTLEDKMLDVSEFGDNEVKVKSLTIKDGIAYVDFNIAMTAIVVADSSDCAIESLSTSLENTLKQFSGIEKVVVSIDGIGWPCQQIDMCGEKIAFEASKTDVFIEKAQAGDGVAVLARRALDKYLMQASYLKELELNPKNEITASQKVYVEDYMQKRISSKPLKIGDVIEISASLISEAINRSYGLSTANEKNLGKYFLPTSPIKAGIASGSEKGESIVWVKYLDEKGNLIKNAKIILTETNPNLNLPIKWWHEAKFSEKNNRYEVSFNYCSSIPECSLCFGINAEKGFYMSQYKNFGCVKLSEYKEF